MSELESELLAAEVQIAELEARNAELVAAAKDAIDCLQDNGHFDASETVDRLRSALTAEGEA